jgi:hypothetical protein
MDSRAASGNLSEDVSEQLQADPDHHVILARRNRLIAMAVAGLASTLSCGGRTAMDHPEREDASAKHGTGGSSGRGAGGEQGTDARWDAIADASGKDASRFLDAVADTAETDVYNCAGCASCGSPGCT